MIDIIIPTYGRPHRVAEVAADIAAATTVEHRVHFVIEVDDVATHEAARALGVWPWCNEGARSYSGAINTAKRYTDGEWLFAGADDLHFHEGWDVAALQCAAENPWAHVIGTDDLLNPYVKQGVHATHYLVRRTYLDEVGGIVDEGPGSFLHEGYSHQYCDTEFIGTARARCVFRPCFESVVEHMHWTAGKSPEDATSVKAYADLAADTARYEERRHLWWEIAL
jgi:hypothetical protein